MKITKLLTRALLAPALLGALCLTQSSSAAVTSVTTVYSGSECRVGGFGTAEAVMTKDGHLVPGATTWAGPQCPIPRTQPSFKRVSVEIYFMDTQSSSEENATTSVSCNIGYRTRNGGIAPSDAQPQPWISKTQVGISRWSSMYLQWIGTESTAEPFFSPLTGSVSKWRTALFSCDLPPNAAIRTYVVTEAAS